MSKLTCVLFCYVMLKTRTSCNCLVTDVFLQLDDLSDSDNVEEVIDKIVNATLGVTLDDHFGMDGDNIAGVVNITEELLDVIIEQDIDYDDPVIDVSNRR